MIKIGLTEARRILGEYALTAEDVIEGCKFEYVVAKGSNPVDMHSPEDPTRVIHTYVKEGGSYDVPYRCLFPKKIEKLLVAGRCISATHEAIASTRSEATCMAEGQAAGTAAALCIRENASPRKLHFEKLQDLLVNQGGILYARRVVPLFFELTRKDPYELSPAPFYLEANPDRRVRDSGVTAEQSGFILC